MTLKFFNGLKPAPIVKLVDFSASSFGIPFARAADDTLFIKPVTTIPTPD